MTINPVDHPVMFETPELETSELAASSEWLEHVPFALLLIDLVRPQSIVELGTSIGVSYCAFCQAIKRLGISATSIAISGGEPRGEGQGGEGQGDDADAEALRALRAHHDPRYGEFSQLIQSSSDEAVIAFADHSIDLLHIAGAHASDGVHHLFSTWLPKMSDCGLVLLDGIAERYTVSGAWRLWDDLTQRFPSSFAIQQGQGLGIVCVGRQLPDGFQQLLACSDEQANTLRRLCYERGMQLKTLQRAVTRTPTTRSDSITTFSETVVRERQSARAATTRSDSITTFSETADHERHDLMTSTVERSRMSEQPAMEREYRRRALYETHMQALEDRVDELTLRLNEIGWAESSRGVRAIKLARSVRSLLDQEGVLNAARRVRLWLRGQRGPGLPSDSQLRETSTLAAPAPGQALSTADVDVSSALAPTTASFGYPSPSAQIRDQHVPSTRAFSGVSIVMPVFNTLEYAQQCVASIYAADCDVPFEIIVVDNGSESAVLDWLRREAEAHHNFFFVSVSSNLGYAGGINLGSRHARGQYLLLAHGDILVTPHWLDSLVSVMEQDYRIGVVSPLTNAVDHGPQLDPLASHLLPEDRETYAVMLREDPTIQMVTNDLIFFGVLVRKQVAALLGGLNETYALGHYTDDDFCLRARLAGYQLAIARNTFVYHVGAKTSSTHQIDRTGDMQHDLVRYLDMMSEVSTTLTPQAPLRSLTNPLVSVVVRTVNRPDTLRLALTSLANQTFANFEVIVVCDAGPDLLQLLDEFSPYLRIRYVHNAQSQGRGEALNIGVRHATGAYVAYLDDDDIVYPTHLETLVNAVLEGEKGTTLAYVDYNNALVTSINGHLATITRVPRSTWIFRYDQLLAQNFLPIHTWLHDRQLWEDIGGFDADMDMLEDWDFLIRAAQRREFIAAQRITCEYRFYLSGSNSSITNRPRTLTAMQEIYSRYLASATVQAHRTQMVASLQAQVAAGTQLQTSAQADDSTSEQEKMRLLSEIGGFAW